MLWGRKRDSLLRSNSKQHKTRDENPEGVRKRPEEIRSGIEPRVMNQRAPGAAAERGVGGSACARIGR